MPKATIAGQTILGSSTVRWSFIDGPAPYIATFDVLAGSMTTVLEGPPKPVELVMDWDGGTLVVSNLYVIEEAASDDPNIARIRVADRRYWWSYQHIKRGFNVRRHNAPKRLQNPGRRELKPVAADVWYAPWSTKDKQGLNPWTAEEILRDIIGELNGAEGDMEGAVPNVRITADITGKLKQLPVEDLEIDDSGPEAMAVALSHLPEVALTIDREGDVVVYSKVSGDERQLIRDAGPESVGGGHVQFMTNGRIRPREVHVLFTREIEVRFDFEELTSKSGSTARGVDDRFADNVLAVPDFELTLDDGTTVAQGTYITFSQALRAWGPPIGFLDDLDYTTIQEGLTPFMDLWAALALSGTAEPNADWMARMSAIQTHYRKTFRINRRWMDRISKLNAFRVATIDPETGTRAPAVAYSDWCVLYSQRAVVGGLGSAYIMNVAGYPRPDPPGHINDESKPAPARVSIMDHDQGIIHVSYEVDVNRVYEMIIPSMIEMSGSGKDGLGRPVEPGPTFDITDKTRAIAFDAAQAGVERKYAKLTSQHKAAIILTALSGSPNTDQQLERVKMQPSDVKDLLPDALAQGIENAQGPVMEVRVSPGIETARVAWVDSAAGDIEKAFGVGEGEPNLRDIMINFEGSQEAASIKSIARAVAAQVYAEFADREQGEKTVSLRPDIQPAGWLTNVTHEIGVEGTVTTTLTLDQQAAKLSIFSLLGDGERSMILKLAQPSKGS